jgi:hypothetical protein
MQASDLRDPVTWKCALYSRAAKQSCRMLFGERGMAVRNLIALLLSGLALGSCNETVHVGLDYAKTTYGYVNNGGFSSGTLLLWDKGKSTITTLGKVDCIRGQSDPSIDIETSYDGTINTSLKLTPMEESIIEGTLKSKSSLVAKDARRFQCTSLVGSLAKYINADPSVLSDWSFADAVKNPDLYYLFVSDVTVGDSIELHVEKEKKVDVGIPVKLGARTVELEIDDSSIGKISGNDVVLMFNVRVLRPTYIKNDEGGRNASFDVLSGQDLGSLRDALRRGA